MAAMTVHPEKVQEGAEDDKKKQEHLSSADSQSGKVEKSQHRRCRSYPYPRSLHHELPPARRRFLALPGEQSKKGAWETKLPKLGEIAGLGRGDAARAGENLTE